jgi:hypothetical protein
VKIFRKRVSAEEKRDTARKEGGRGNKRNTKEKYSIE